ncbi:oligosaccharide flippase family protein [Curtobacterium sp. MCSS17_007]|nr:oligosaccharide flippase family protein [Curtobacterium sp. MCSS17_007]WIE77273.1 oligosaccharide flippase family protein [Curtobacterium sp. MCSS17_007]
MAGPLAGLASAPLLAHGLGVDGRGEVAAVTAPILLAATVSAVGIPDAVTYFVARTPGSAGTARRRGSALVGIAALTAAVVVVALAPTLAAGSHELTPQIAVLALTVVPSALVGILRGTAAGLGHWGQIAIERTVGPAVRLVAFIVLWLSDSLSVASAATVITLAPVISGLAYLRSDCQRTARDDEAEPEDSLREQAAGVVQLLGYGTRAWVGSLAGVALSRLDQVLMTPLGSTEQLGLYAVAATISELPLVLTTAVREVVLTTHARDPDEHALAQAGRTAFAASAAAALLIGASAPWCLPIVFGSGFDGAVPPTVVLLVAVTIGVPGSVAGAGLSARGLPHLRSASMVIGAVVNVVALVVLVPSWGAVGAAVATLVSNVVAGSINVGQVSRLTAQSFASFHIPTRADASCALRCVRRCCRTHRLG